ncbi:hypothetical protein DFQ26_004240 [Actinomortierella ambigua]|nr:hypothetical protein DFQ26_004240 [Actinomortierella ambigua]
MPTPRTMSQHVNTANATIGQLKESVGKAIGNESFAAAGAEQRTAAELKQHDLDSTTRMEGLQNVALGEAQKVLGTLKGDDEMTARGHGNVAKGHVQRNA